MATKATPEQKRRIAHLLSEIDSERDGATGEVVRQEAALLPIEGAILLLSLINEGAWGVDADAVQSLTGLGYARDSQVLAVSRLIEGPGHRMTVPRVLFLGLPCQRAEDLLEITPQGTRLIAAADDKSWRRAVLSLPKEDLRSCIERSESRVELWTSAVSAHDPSMAKRIREFTDAGYPHIPWIISGHSLDALRSIASAPDGGRLTRSAIHSAVRTLDRGDITQDGDEQ